MSLLEYLSGKEKEMIVRYIETYAFHSEHNGGITAPLDHILRFWDKAKQQYLFPMFGEQLILKKEINYVKDAGELSNEMYRAVFENCRHEFIVAYYDLLDRLRDSLGSDTYWRLRDFIDTDSLVQNVYENENVLIIPTPDGKSIKINKGTRVVRTLGKIATAFNLPGFEDFRLKHSMVLNQKGLKGDLCLSIHPLDYMTMSDNECDWESCMSWKNDGCYRHGTVEMMNSPMVVVAYLTAKDDMQLTYRVEDKWNNKKWRELYVITPEIITNVKAYPYYNKDLTAQVLGWLKELAVAAGIGVYHDNVEEWEYEYQSSNTFLHDEDIRFYFETHYMYNDFDADGYQYSYFSRALPCKQITIMYSGESECMCCGTTNVDFYENEGYLICDDCEGYSTCSYCGCRIYDNQEYYEVDDDVYCESCYENHTFEDAYDGCRYSLRDSHYVDFYLGVDLSLAGKIDVRADGFYSEPRPLRHDDVSAVYKHLTVRVNSDNINSAIKDWSTTGEAYQCIRRWSPSSFIIRVNEMTDEFAEALGFDNAVQLYQDIQDEYHQRRATLL